MKKLPKIANKVSQHPKKRRDYDGEEPPPAKQKSVQVILEIEPVPVTEVKEESTAQEDDGEGSWECWDEEELKPLLVPVEEVNLGEESFQKPDPKKRKNFVSNGHGKKPKVKSAAKIKKESTTRDEGEGSSSSRDAWCVTMKTALNVSCEDRVNQYPDGTLHVDEASGSLYCSSCLIPVDHFRKGTIDKHLKSRKHAESSKQITEESSESVPAKKGILRVNTFQKPNTKKRKNLDKSDVPEDEPEAPNKSAKQEANQVAKTAINVAPADRVDQYPAGTLHADANQLFCSACNISLDHTRKGSIDKHLKTRLHTEKRKRLDDQRSKKLTTVTASFAKTTEARDARNLALYQLVEAFTAADIPLKKLDHPKLRQYLMENVPNLGALPHFSTLRTGYLPKVLENLRAEKQQRMAALDEVIDTVTIDSLSYLIEKS